jgi:plastocyanin
MRKSLAPIFIAAVSTVAFVASPVRAADVAVTGTDSRDEACAAAFGSSAKCFYVNGKLTAAITNGAVSATNPITAAVGDTITLRNTSGMHNMVFCAEGSTVNGWKCGDPITSASDPGGARTSATGAPSAIPESGGTLKLDAAGNYYFWCGLGSHRFGGQYGKLVVTGASAGGATATTKPATPTTAASVAPTLTLKKAANKITATGKATPGAKVTLQRQSGTSWVAVASATASGTGNYTISAKAETKTTTYRVVVGTRTSATRRA